MPWVRRWAIVIHTLLPNGSSAPKINTRSAGQMKSEYSRPEVTPIHSNPSATARPIFQVIAVQSPSFSDQSLVLPNAGVMYIMVMAKAFDIQPKMTAITCTCRIWPNENISTPVTKSGNANLAALYAPMPEPITNHKIAEKPNYIVVLFGC